MEQQKIIDEINYYKVQAITELLYARGMIIFDEYDKLTDLNRQIFSPMYVDLLPKSLEKSPNQIFQYRKTRYRGLRKQTSKLNIMFALANLYLADRKSLTV